MNTDPKSFCFNKSKIKAIVLGCDPTNFSNKGNRVSLSYAFGIGQDPRYFMDVLKNLNIIGLNLEDIYITNLVRTYLKDETEKNTTWEISAKRSLKDLFEELEEIDPKRKLPVFLTAKRIYTFLLNDNIPRQRPKDIYDLKAEIPIKPENNKLKRNLFPLFRHYEYSLAKNKEYSIKLQTIFNL